MNRRGFLGLVLVTPWLKGLRLALPPLPPPVFPTGYVLRISNNPHYEFGFTGFQPGDDDRIVGQIQASARLHTTRHRAFTITAEQD